MSADLFFILSLSIAFAAIIGLVRFNRISPAFYPFILEIWMALTVEIVMYWLGSTARSGGNSVLNIFSLLDSLLFTILFYNWGLFKRSKIVLYLFLAFFLISWIIITFFVHGFENNNWYFRLIYSFALIFFSVTYFNKLVVTERGNIFRNSKFLICLGLIIFFTFFTITCAAQLSFLGQNPSKEFWRKLGTINLFSNVFVNILYAIAVLWIPRKKSFTTAY